MNICQLRPVIEVRTYLALLKQQILPVMIKVLASYDPMGRVFKKEIRVFGVLIYQRSTHDK